MASPIFVIKTGVVCSKQLLNHGFFMDVKCLEHFLYQESEMKRGEGSAATQQLYGAVGANILMLYTRLIIILPLASTWEKSEIFQNKHTIQILNSRVIYLYER